MTHIRLKHTYGSGHLHGLSAPDLHLEIALEPDALHRETQRRLSLSTSVSTGDHTQPLILERGYTATGQLDHLALRSPHRASEQHYQYDALGRMTFRTQQGDSPTIAYTYDKAGRLIASQHGHDAHHYPVDAAGNRSAAPNATNQLAQLNGTRYRYDSAGNLIHREHPDGERLTLGYDGANRLVQLTHISKLGYTRHAHYRYDGLGRRISKTVSHTDGTTATTHYGWDGDRIVHEETSNQRTTVVYEPGSFVPMLRIDQSNGNEEEHLSAYVTDALGTPLQLLSPNGQPRWLAEPDDWAAVTNQRAVRGVTQPIRFQGQWHDEESGLYYNRHRYYDPEQGRYISQDPIGLRGGTNLYGYVTNPTGMVDPLGLSTWEAIKFHSRMIPRFIRDEGMDVISRSATVIGGGGQVLLGGALCKTVVGCVAGAPIAGLGASNIQEGFSESGQGFAREVAVDQLGEQWGNLAVDGANLGTSVGGLLRPVKKPGVFQLFRRLPDDYMPAYKNATRGSLLLETVPSSIGVRDGVYKQFDLMRED